MADPGGSERKSDPHLGPDFPFRSKAENSMDDVAAFRARWDGRVPAAEPFVLVRSEFGNVGRSTEPGTYSAPDLCPHDPQWDEAVEPGIRPLVDAFIRRWNCITYTSCEGHCYPGRDLTPAPAEVGLLPRDEAEFRALARRLAELRRRLATVPAAEPRVPTVIWRADLQCLATGRIFPAFDVVIQPEPGLDWATYFSLVPTAIERTAAVAGATFPAGRTAPITGGSNQEWRFG